MGGVTGEDPPFKGAWAELCSQSRRTRAPPIVASYSARETPEPLQNIPVCISSLWILSGVNACGVVYVYS